MTDKKKIIAFLQPQQQNRLKINSGITENLKHKKIRPIDLPECHFSNLNQKRNQSENSTSNIRYPAKFCTVPHGIECIQNFVFVVRWELWSWLKQSFVFWQDVVESQGVQSRFIRTSHWRKMMMLQALDRYFIFLFCYRTKQNHIMLENEVKK